MASFSFLYPSYLYLLLLVPFFIFIYFFSLGYNKKRAFVFSNFRAIERFYGIEFFSKNYLALYLNILIIILFVLSLSGMQVIFPAKTSAYSFVLLIDNSGSMSTTDMAPNRFSVAKEAARDFIDELPIGVNVGVIGFSGEAIVYQKITTDKMKIKMAIDNIDFGTVEGTNIYNALISADRLFDNSQEDNFRSVIIISDGQINVGEAPQIISFAERSDIVINTIAVGTKEGGISKYNTISKTDVDFLKSLAFNSRGVFFEVEDQKGLKNSFKSLIEEVDGTVEMDISLYLLLGALGLFTLYWVLFNLRFKTFP